MGGRAWGRWRAPGPKECAADVGETEVKVGECFGVECNGAVGETEF